MVVNPFDLEPGTRLRLKGGAVVEVTDNPRDGQWLHVRHLDGPADASTSGSDELCHADEVQEVLAPEQGDKPAP